MDLGRVPAVDRGCDYKSIAEGAVSLLCSVGCFGLDRSRQRQLWQKALDLDRELHPHRPRTIVWTEEDGDVDPPRRPDGTPIPGAVFHGMNDDPQTETSTEERNRQ